MNRECRKASLTEVDEGYKTGATPSDYDYAGPLSRHVADGDYRLERLEFDPSPEAMRLWNFVLTEEERLADAQSRGMKIVGTMKDLGTVPIMAFSLPNLVAFYPDGAWWSPCVMEQSDGLLRVADKLGIDESFCPVRAMLGAFVLQDRFPLPDVLICSSGATCDDFSAIAQRLESLGHPITWWEIPHRRGPAGDTRDIEIVESELRRIAQVLSTVSGHHLDDALLSDGIEEANRIRALLRELRSIVYTTDPGPLPALEMLLAEILSIHFCSDRSECEAVLSSLLSMVRSRVAAGDGPLPRDNVRVFWVNPVADLRVMNLLEDCGGRICGTDYMFGHAMMPIPENLPPLRALATVACADPMTGSAFDRAASICKEAKTFGAEAMVISRIPGASHCATEGMVIREIVSKNLGIPIVEIEVPCVADPMRENLRTRLEALVETARSRRNSSS